MTWTLVNADELETVVTIVDDLSDPDRIAFSFKLEAKDGKQLMKQAGYATQAKEE